MFFVQLCEIAVTQKAQRTHKTHKIILDYPM